MSNFTVVVDEDIFDVTDPDHTVIAHGVNRFGVMGGFAALIDKNFPEDAQFYRDMCPFTPEDLETISREDAEADEFDDDGLPKLNLARAVLSRLSDGPTIAHACTQAFPGTDAREDALWRTIHALVTNRNADRDFRAEIRVPLIGGGIGGIKPTKAASLIRHAALTPWGGNPVTLYLRSDDPSTAEILEFLNRSVVEN